MKIFIAGARSVKSLAPPVRQKLMSIYIKDFDVLIGDCSGVDSSVQSFFAGLNYPNVTVYASGSMVRNNIGNWRVESIPVPQGVKGFDFYKQKDIAMAADADFGFMIWDGKSKGTLNNTINLLKQNKRVLVFLTTQDRMFVLKSMQDLSDLITDNAPGARSTYFSLLTEPSQQLTIAI